jgi:hypothetical protein
MPFKPVSVLKIQLVNIDGVDKEGNCRLKTIG